MTAEDTLAPTGTMAGASGGGERRRHPRCPVGGRAVAFYGGCTCAVHDVSVTGLALRCAVFDAEQRAADQVDIFLADSALYLPGLPIRLVAEACIAPPSMFSSLRVCRLGLQFGLLSGEQQRSLDEFIAVCRAPLF